MSNISHGRTSASTLDDTTADLSTKSASTRSTSDADSESEGDVSRRKKAEAGHRRQPQERRPFGRGSCSAQRRGQFRLFCGRSPTRLHGAPGGSKNPKPGANTLIPHRVSCPQVSIKTKILRAKQAEGEEASWAQTGPASGLLYSPSSRQPSVAFNPAMPSAPGEDRGSRISRPSLAASAAGRKRKVAIGQRPLHLCRDAGIPAEPPCISEDEGNAARVVMGTAWVSRSQKDNTFGTLLLLPPAPIAAALTTVPLLFPHPGYRTRIKKRKEI